MEFEPALVQELGTIAALGGRIYPIDAPETPYDLTQPYLVYGSSEGQRDKSLDGFLKSKSVRAELNVIAPRYSDVKAITREVIALLIDMEGRTIGTSGPFIEELTYQMPIEFYENQPNLYRCSIEFTAYFEEVST